MYEGKYIIYKITDLEGKIRSVSQEHYNDAPGNIALLVPNYHFCFQFDEYTNNNRGVLKTTFVQGVKHVGDEIIVTTSNSIYYLKPFKLDIHWNLSYN